tara:strand:- start:23 stop:535 length:513 start_codon:yes stop_codon:yes gene_type:complete
MKGMWNILWVLLPIIGWFALGGYGVRIIKEFSKGKFKQLPTFKFKGDLKLGFFMFLKAIPFFLVYIVAIGIITLANPLFGGLSRLFVELFLIPILTINFMNKETVGSYFELNIIKFVFNNFGDYVIAVLKSILLALIFVVMYLILIGIPAQTFTQNIFLADFYRRRVTAK